MTVNSPDNLIKIGSLDSPYTTLDSPKQIILVDFCLLASTSPGRDTLQFKPGTNAQSAVDDKLISIR